MTGRSRKRREKTGCDKAIGRCASVECGFEGFVSKALRKSGTFDGSIASYQSNTR